MNVASLLRPKPAAPPDLAPDPLIVERDRALRALERFSVFDARVGDAQAANQRANDALRAFVAEETAALRRWAEGEGNGAAPTRDVARHSELVAACLTPPRENTTRVSRQERRSKPATLARVRPFSRPISNWTNASPRPSSPRRWAKWTISRGSSPMRKRGSRGSSHVWASVSRKSSPSRRRRD